MKIADIIMERTEEPAAEFIDCLALYLDTPWHDLEWPDRERVARAFDTEMARLPAQRLWRGIGLDSLDDLVLESGELETGGAIVFPGYLSATKNKATAAEYAASLPYPELLVFEIRTHPAGYGIDVADYAAWLDPEYMRKYGAAEAEVIIDRRTRFTVAGIAAEAGSPAAGGRNLHWVHLEQTA